MAHRRPSQRMISVRAGPPRVRESPTAQASEADRATTAFRKLPPEGRSGLGTVRHALPCQRSTSVLAGPPGGRVTPTAHTSPEAAADTPSSSSDSREPAAPACTCHPPWQPAAGPAPPVHDGSTARASPPPQAHRRRHPVITEAPPGTSGQVASHLLSLGPLTARDSTIQKYSEESDHERRDQQEGSGRVDRRRERPPREVIDLHRQRLCAGTAGQVPNGDEVV